MCGGWVCCVGCIFLYRCSLGVGCALDVREQGYWTVSHCRCVLAIVIFYSCLFPLLVCINARANKPCTGNKVHNVYSHFLHGRWIQQLLTVVI